MVDLARLQVTAEVRTLHCVSIAVEYLALLIFFDGLCYYLSRILDVCLFGLHYFVSHIEHAILVDSTAGHDVSKHEIVVKRFF